MTDVLVVGRLGVGPTAAQGRTVHVWGEAAARESEPAFEPVAFEDPLWVLFSSGTTGRPKGIVQSHGGILLELLKLLTLHLDLGPADRLFWFTSPSWVMWNIQSSALATGASILCYDGAPHHPDARRLWQLAADHHVTVLGCSPGYLDASRATGLEPARDLNLGVAMDAWDADGRPVRGEVGELVMTRPLPSMPVRFWDDPDGVRYRESYFETYPGVWRHGDWVTVTDRDSVVIHGRSDATLNRHGVRMGSADIYHAVEDVEGIAESLVLGVEEPDGGYWMPLFVVLADAGATLDDRLRDQVRETIRRQVSPRHVPDEIIQVPALPHTRTGKRLEVPITRMLQGADPDTVVQRTALDDPDLLAPFLEIARRRRSDRG